MNKYDKAIWDSHRKNIREKNQKIIKILNDWEDEGVMPSYIVGNMMFLEGVAYSKGSIIKKVLK